ncbi:hypothetical protein BC2230_200038 [Burkholderia cepacia]
MSQSSFVNIEGELTYPRLMPLNGIPFGREWTFLGALDARTGKHRLVRIVTSCINVMVPHRTCRWQPMNRSASEPAAGPLLDSARRMRRATVAAC